MTLAGRSSTTRLHITERVELNIEPIKPKIAKIFKRLKNREDGSDFDDFYTKSSVSTQRTFSKFFELTKSISQVISYGLNGVILRNADLKPFAEYRS